MTKSKWLNLIIPIIQSEASARGYKYPSAIIAQAILESNWGQSTLAAKYYNYFGMKCGSSWTGKSVNLSTKEEYTAGTLTTIKSNFRVYDDMAAGVAGYFDFISKPRYKNLLTATSSYNYLELIKADGYATSANYVKNVYAVVTKYNLLLYDKTDSIPTDLDDVITTIANYVISGYFGNGHELRKENIYKLIRERVNELCKTS